MPIVAFANNQIDETLLQADKVKTSSPERLNLLLSTIPVKGLNSSQKDLYSYLTAFSFLMKGDTQEGIKRLEYLVKNTQSIEIKPRALSTLLNAYSGLHEWSKAFTSAESLQKSLKLIHNPQIKDTADIATLSFYNDIEEYKTVNTHTETLIETTTSDKTKCLAMDRQLYSRMHLSTSNLQEGDFFKAIDLCRSINQKVIVQSIIANLADFNISHKFFEKAHQLLIENLPQVESIGFPPMTSSFLSLIVKNYMQKNALNEAEPYANRILNEFSEDDYSQPHRIAYHALTQLNESKGNYKKALLYYKKYMAIESKDFNNRLAQKLAIQKAQIDRDNQLKLLNKENTLLMTQTELVAERTRNTQLLFTGTFLLLCITIIWLIKSRITHKMLRKIAQTDELTGTCSRHFFTSQVQSSLRHCHKNSHEVGFIMLDLDHFKQVNDTYGHQAGDWALKQAVLAVQSVCRANDIIGRLGGEEFAILLPNCGTEKASQLAESCRKAIAEIDTNETGYNFVLTASFGISHNTQAGYDLDKLFGCADQALYRSKNSGRNKVYAYQDEVAVPS